MRIFCGLVPEFYIRTDSFIGVASWCAAKQHWLGIGFTWLERPNRPKPPEPPSCRIALLNLYSDVKASGIVGRNGRSWEASLAAAKAALGDDA